MADPVAWAAGLGLLGAILGSFVATLVVRWPQGRSVLRGRSACDGCGRTLGGLELVPIVSFALQRGRCRSCGAAIDPRHPTVELLALGIGAASGWAAPGLEGVAGAVFGWLLLALGGLDLAALWLPDRLTAILAAAGLAAGLLGVEPLLADRLIGSVAGFGSLWLVGWSFHRLRGRQGLGGGDPKLFGAIGLWLGWRLLPAVLLIACLVGLGVAAWRLLLGRRVAGSDAMPLGTLLALAAYPAWLAMILMSG
ncbi:prepilin peptidase [Sphingomonas bacterium]|uniref:prepilin peptidase n=1 Tax=Sphingomonas bacterium TaxID=1895847 RepID=UPI001575A23C|nr:A24 family peptidase [Sphingomonas bacterium]